MDQRSVILGLTQTPKSQRATVTVTVEAAHKKVRASVKQGAVQVRPLREETRVMRCKLRVTRHRTEFGATNDTTRQDNKVMEAWTLNRTMPVVLTQTEEETGAHQGAVVVGAGALEEVTNKTLTDAAGDRG